MSKTKEEILKSKNLHSYYYPNGNSSKPMIHDIDCHFCDYETHVEEAMSEHAKNECIAFFDWWNGYKKEVEGKVNSMPYSEERKLAAIEWGKLVNLSTHEKYQLYLDSLTK